MEDPTPNPMGKLLPAIEHLEQTAAQNSERSGELAAALSGAYREAARTHQALLGLLDRLAEPCRAAAAQVSAGSEQAAPWQSSQQQAAAAAQEMAAAVTGAQEALSMLDEALIGALAAQQAGPAELQRAETRAAAARQTAFDEQTCLLAQEQTLLAETQAYLEAAVACVRAAAQDAARLQNAENAAQAVALKQEALAAREAGRPQTALALLEAAIALSPGDADLSLHLARLYLEAGQPERAQALCRRAAESLPPDSPALAYTQGLLALQEGDPARAVERLTQAVAGGLGTPCRLRLAEAHYRAGHPLQAVEEWRRILTLDPDEPEALAWLRQVD